MAKGDSVLLCPDVGLGKKLAQVTQRILRDVRIISPAALADERKVLAIIRNVDAVIVGMAKGDEAEARIVDLALKAITARVAVVVDAENDGEIWKFLKLLHERSFVGGFRLVAGDLAQEDGENLFLRATFVPISSIEDEREATDLAQALMQYFL